MKPKLIPVRLESKTGIWVILENCAMGYVAWIHCIYIVGKFDNLRQAKKVANSINEILVAKQVDHSSFSWFKAEVKNGKLPLGAKVLTPIRTATPATIYAWLEQHLPQEIEAADFDDDAQNEQMTRRRFPEYCTSGNSIFYDGAPCSVA